MSRETHHRWWRRLLGASASIPAVPQLGIGFPLAMIPTILTLGVRRTTPRPPWVLPLIGAATLTAIVTVISAAVNDTTIASAAVGHAIAFVLSLAAYRVAVTDTTEAAQLTFWFHLGYLGYALLLLPDARVYNLGFEGFWKFGVGTPAVIIAIYLVIRAQAKTSVVATTILLFGAVSIVVGFRALGLACFVAFVIIVVRAVTGTRRKWLALIAAGGALAILALVLPALVASGAFGHEVAYRTQAQTDESGPAILGGRSEPPLSIAAIMMKPLFGWGNSQALDNDAIGLGVQVAQGLGMGDQSNYVGYWVRRDGFVSLHSIFLGTWAEGGPLAAVFPLTLIVLFAVAGVLATGRWAPLVTIVAFKSAWDVVFSPWSSNRGVQLAVVAILCALALVESKRQRAEAVAVHPKSSAPTAPAP